MVGEDLREDHLGELDTDLIPRPAALHEEPDHCGVGSGPGARQPGVPLGPGTPLGHGAWPGPDLDGAGEGSAPPWGDPRFPPVPHGGAGRLRPHPRPAAKIFAPLRRQGVGKSVAAATAVVVLLGLAVSAYLLLGRMSGGGSSAARTPIVPLATASPVLPVSPAATAAPAAPVSSVPAPAPQSTPAPGSAVTARPAATPRPAPALSRPDRLAPAPLGGQEEVTDVTDFAGLARAGILTPGEVAAYQAAQPGAARLAVADFPMGRAVVALVAVASPDQALAARDRLTALQLASGLQPAPGSPPGVPIEMLPVQPGKVLARAFYASGNLLVRVEFSGTDLNAAAAAFLRILAAQLGALPANT